MEVVQVWPDLQEIGIKDTIGSIRIPVSLPCWELLKLMCLPLLHRPTLEPLNTCDH